MSGTIAFANNTERAAWYFLNVLDGVACIDKVIPFEDYSDLRDVAEAKRQPARSVCRYCGEHEPEDCICDWMRQTNSQENRQTNRQENRQEQTSPANV